MRLKQKLLIALVGFIMLIFVLGVWGYITIDSINYTPAAPAALPDLDYGIEKESKVKVEQIPQEELDEMLGEESSQGNL
ncbi:MAG: hypothetical protein ACERKO_12825 [Acetanaerobacterium sp.]